MNDNLHPLRRATLAETGDCFFIGKARDLNRALYGMAERAVGRAPAQDVDANAPGYVAGLSKQVMK